MNYIFKSIAVLLLVFSAYQLKAQTSEIDFTLTSKSINVTGQNVDISSTINKSESTLIWTLFANDNTDINSFIITDTTGNWNPDTSMGSITYALIMDDQQANLTLLGQETGISATLTFTTTDDEEENYIFNIDTFSYQ